MMLVHEMAPGIWFTNPRIMVTCPCSVCDGRESERVSLVYCSHLHVYLLTHRTLHRAVGFKLTKAEAPVKMTEKSLNNK